MRFLSIAVIVAGCGQPSTRAKAVEVAHAPPPPPDAPMIDAGMDAAVDAAPPRRPQTTVTEFTFVPPAPLPPMPTVAAFAKLGNPRIVRIAINTWSGWGPLLWANEGTRPKKVWKDPRNDEFQVELVVVDNAVAVRDQIAIGTIHVGWSTADQLPLLATRGGLGDDPRTLPYVIEQTDWSHGGDGLVARDAIPRVNALRGKTIVLAQNSPSHYLLSSLLHDAGIAPAEVNLKFVADAFQAAAAFAADVSIDAAVTWSPDLEELAKPGFGNHVLVDTKLADHAIAGLLFTRADFATANPGIVEALARGTLAAVDTLADGANANAVGSLIDTAFALPAGTGKQMLDDVSWANADENGAFFDPANLTGFEHTFAAATALYKLAPPKRKLIANTALKRSARALPPAPPVGDAGAVVIAKRITINFFPNSSDLRKTVPGPKGKKDVPYDPNVDASLDDVAHFIGRLGGAHIEISGHTDGSMRDVADAALVRELSLRRATAVRDQLVTKYRFPASRFTVVGVGWDVPADPADPDNHAKNRRIEIAARR